MLTRQTLQHQNNKGETKTAFTDQQCVREQRAAREGGRSHNRHQQCEKMTCLKAKGRQSMPWWALWRDPQMGPGWWEPLEASPKPAPTHPSLGSQPPLPAGHKYEAGHTLEGPVCHDEVPMLEGSQGFHGSSQQAELCTPECHPSLAVLRECCGNRQLHPH